MDRRAFICADAGIFGAVRLDASAQPAGRVFRVGILRPAAPAKPTDHATAQHLLPAALAQQDRTNPRIGCIRGDPLPQPYIDAFEQGLRERGDVPDQSVLIEYRFDHSDGAELERIGRELVSLKSMSLSLAVVRARAVQKAPRSPFRLS